MCSIWGLGLDGKNTATHTQLGAFAARRLYHVMHGPDEPGVAFGRMHYAFKVIPAALFMDVS